MLRPFIIALAAPLALAAQTPSRPDVHVLATGGTIANAGAGPRRTVEDLVAAIPGLDSVARVTVEQFSNKGSGDITVDDWRRLATRVNELFRVRPSLAGIVVTHGTDTMEETAWFLDLTVRGCRPVVVTGAMRRAVDVGADGPANLRNAVRAAAAAQSRSRGVMVLMNDELFGARAVAKTSTSRLDAFAAPGAGPLGVADPDGVVFAAPAPPCDGAALAGSSPARFDLERLGPLPRVDVIYSHVDADSVPIDAAVAAGARGLVVASVGRGGTTPSQSTALRRARLGGVALVMSSRTGSGRVPANWSIANGAGAVVAGAEELSPQKARVLLMLALAAGADVGKVFGQ